MKKTRAPKDPAAKPPRANSAWAHHKHVIATRKRSTPPAPSVPPISPDPATPTSSNEPSLAKLPTPPSTVRSSSGSKRAEEASSAPRPLPDPGAPAVTVAEDERGFTTPQRLLAEAGAILDEEDARQFLVQALDRAGWREDNLDMVADCLCHDLNAPGSTIAYMIERFRTAAENLSRFSFQDWQQLTVFWNEALWQLEKHYGDINYAIPLIQYAEQIWTSRSDQRCARYWMLGNLWAHVDHRTPDMATVEAWFEDFGGLTEPERERCRRVWHDAHERAAYDALPLDFILQRSFLSDKLQEKLSCNGVAEFALQTARDWRTMFPNDPIHERNHVVTRLVLKSSIIGLKRGLIASEGCLYAVTAPWACSGLLEY